MQGLILTDESNKIDVDVSNSKFEDNFSFGSGTVFAASSMQRVVNALNFTNNTFLKNKCLKNGAVFYLTSTKHIITLINNTYQENFAQGSGGVGYTFKSEIDCSEYGSIYVSMILINDHLIKIQEIQQIILEGHGILIFEEILGERLV